MWNSGWKISDGTIHAGSCRNATRTDMLLSEAGMCASPFSGNNPSDAPYTPGVQPEPELDRAAPPFLSRRQPRFLSRRSRNAGGVLIGGAAIAGAAALGAAASATAALAATWRVRAARLKGKIVLITGSSRGLGLAMAEEFGRRGARIVLTAREPEELDRARTMLLRKEVV